MINLNKFPVKKYALTIDQLNSLTLEQYAILNKCHIATFMKNTQIGLTWQDAIALSPERFTVLNSYYHRPWNAKGGYMLIRNSRIGLTWREAITFSSEQCAIFSKELGVATYREKSVLRWL